MLIREVSDLHLEFCYDQYDAPTGLAAERLSTIIPHLPEDSETVLIVGGDLATARRVGRIGTFLRLVLPRFKHVIYVLGNHEHYNFVMDETLPTIWEEVSKDGMPTNLTIAGNVPEKVEIDGVTFLCGTLWTNYGGADAEEVHALVKRHITDHKVIFTKDIHGTHAVSPRELSLIHRKTLEQFAEWMEGADTSRTVICTHHMPSFTAVDPRFMMDAISRVLNHAFASDLDDFILKYRPAVWTFGHTHARFFGKVGTTQLICNPFGYPNEGNLQSGVYDPMMRFDI